MNDAFNKDKDGNWIWTYDFAVGDTAVFRGWPGKDVVHTGIEVGEAFVVEEVRSGWIWSSKFPNSYHGYQPNLHNNHMFVPLHVWIAGKRDDLLRELGI